MWHFLWKLWVLTALIWLGTVLQPLEPKINAVTKHVETSVE